MNPQSLRKSDWRFSAVLALLFLSAFACAAFTGKYRDEITGTLKPVFIYDFDGIVHDRLGDAAPDGSGGAYLLASQTNSADIVRVGGDGKELWRAEVDFGANAIA